MVPQVLGWVYFALLASDVLHKDYGLHLGLFFCATISISAFGYLLNDFFDVQSDLLAGKKNVLATYRMPTRIIAMLIPLTLGITTWLLMPFRAGATALFALQIIALFIYSAPPFRLKEQGLAGVMADAFYGHINPAFIALTALGGYSKALPNAVTFALILALALTLKGVRNILLHQIEDRKKDKRAGLKTFVLQKGALFSLNLINRLLPFEIALTVSLALFISFFMPPFLLSILFFSVLTYLKFSGWKLAYLPARQLKFKFHYFLNDYFEGWLPVFFLLLLAIKHAQFVWLLPVHLLLFPAFITKLVKDLKTIAHNFKTEDDY